MKSKLPALLTALSFLILSCSNDDDNQTTSIDPTLIAHYNFKGNANDISTYHNTGVIDGPFLTQDSNNNENSAFYFDGIDDVISVPHNDVFSNLEEFTIIALVRTDEIKSQTVVRKGAEVNGPNKSPFGISFSATNSISFFIGSNNGEDYNVLSSNEYEINTWYEIAAIYKEQVMYLYINGELIDTKTIVGTMNPNTSPILIGTRLSLPSSTFKGTIDDIKIFNRAILME
nr:LamG domain-containing protein [uncultured Psychroserpens sp.]